MSDWGDLAEHTGTLISLIAVLATLCGFLLWRTVARIERKLEEVANWMMGFIGQCKDCKSNIIKTIMDEREHDWREYFWRHTHYPDEVGGKVKILDGKES